MRKIYSFMLTTLLVFLASFEANAALTTTITWDIPGSIEIYVGGVNDANKVTLPEGATSYVATIDSSWGSTYVGATPGHALKDGVCVETGDVLNVVSYSKKININMSTYDGKTIKINAGKIEYDAEFEVNVINGRDKINCSLDGTAREIKLKTGVNTIPYSTEYEPKVFFSATADEAEDFYLKQDGVEVEWTNFYGTIKNNNGFALSPNTKFEIKYCNTDDEPEVVNTKTVTLNYENDMARAALEMVFNVTQYESVKERDQIVVNEGDVLRFGFNTTDYDVTFDGSKIEPSTEKTTLKEVTVTGDVTYVISATERQYGETDLYFYASDIEGLVLQDLNEKPIDASKIQATGSTTSHTFTLPGEDKKTKTATVNEYKVTVSLKSPKAFVVPADGWWIESSETGSGEELNHSTLISSASTLYVLNTKLALDKKLVVYLALPVGGDVSESDVLFKDNRGNFYDLKKGYSEFTIDSDYSSSFTASLISSEESPAFSYFCNGEQVLGSGDPVQYIASIDGDALLHIFAGRPAAAQYTVDVEIADGVDGAEVLVDRFTTLTATGSAKTFAGCEVSVTPGKNDLKIDGETPEYEGEAYIFKVTGNHKIEIAPATDGISGTINNAGTKADVISLDGRVIIRNADSNKMNSLPRGIYIINGKKIVK